jgi:4-amino-4-deoxychorismate lyase
LLVREGRARTVELHLGRMTASAEAAGLPELDRDEWRPAIELAVEQWGKDREGALRLVYTRGREGGSEPTAFLLVTPVADRIEAARRDGVSVVTLERGFSVDLAGKAPWQLLGAKTLSYATNMAALRHAESLGVDDVVFVSSEGCVLEGPRSTVVIARGRTLLTPPPAQGILPGTTQQALFEVADQRDFAVRYETLRPADLIVADGVWLVSSVALAARVHTLDGHPLERRALVGEVEELVDLAVDTVA